MLDRGGEAAAAVEDARQDSNLLHPQSSQRDGLKRVV